MNMFFTCAFLGFLTVTSCQLTVDMIPEGVLELCPNIGELFQEFRVTGTECSVQFHNLSVNTNVCSHVETMTTCIQSVIDVGKKCNGSKARTIVEAAEKAMKASSDFLCEDGGRRFADVMQDPNFGECVKNLGISMGSSKQCTDLRNPEDRIDKSGLLVCEYLSDYESCIIGGLEGCPSKKVRSFFEDSVTSNLDALSCPNSAFGRSAQPILTILGLVILQLITFFKL